MFENLSERFSNAFRQLTGKAVLSEDNIQEVLREVRVALLEADVALPVTKDFIEQIRQKAIGQQVIRHLSPEQAFIKLVHEELLIILGKEAAPLNVNAQPPAIILMAGLQGSGKTTSVAKLAKFIKEKLNKNVMVTSTDIYRPAAIEQLETLAKQVGASFFPSQTNQKPVAIAQAAIQQAKIQFADILIIDTAGRLHIDSEMMSEIKALHQATQPIETLFVVDSMTGQDAANTAKAFNDALSITGVVLTKVDGDARGGAALSIKMITGKPIKFIGLGEKTDALSVFHPDRIASRILGMGDVLSLIEEVEQKVDEKKAKKLAKKIQKGQGFDLEDFRDQLNQMSQLGGMSSLLDKLPGMGNMMKQAKAGIDDKLFKKMETIIDSMTLHERRFPNVINGSRKQRIAKGSGVQIQDINRLLKQFGQMQKMMKKFGKGGMKKMLRNMQSFLPPGGAPGGFF